MPSGADLFVVCKQCGSEVSPYITECPYCGHRLRRRAPKLPRANAPERAKRARGRARSLLRRAAAAGARATRRASVARRAARRWDGTTARTRRSRWWRRAAWRGSCCACGTAARARTHGDRGPAARRMVEAVHERVRLRERASTRSWRWSTIALFGWLLERATGRRWCSRCSSARASRGRWRRARCTRCRCVSGGNAAALALLAAWAAPDLRAARAGGYYEGDLLGAAGDRCAAAGAAVRARLSSGRAEASWLAGAVGARSACSWAWAWIEPLQARARSGTYDGRAHDHDQRGGADRG